MTTIATIIDILLITFAVFFVVLNFKALIFHEDQIKELQEKVKDVNSRLTDVWLKLPNETKINLIKKWTDNKRHYEGDY